MNADLKNEDRQKTLSIIIPSYNMEMYLRNTLDSCLTRDASVLDLYEVIIVNDGSKDSTQAIAEEYVHKYKNTFKLLNKENGGYGSAVNEGMKAASGKYVRILDADDWYDPNALQEFVEKLLGTDADMVITNLEKVREKKRKSEYIPLSFEKNVEFDLEDNEYTTEALSIWECCYKTSIFKEHDIQLTEHCYYSDTQWVVYPMRYAKTAIYYPITLYHYRIGRQGQSVSKKSLQKNAMDFERILRDINASFADGLGLNSRRIECAVANTYYALICAILLRPCNKENKKKIKEYMDECQEKYPYGFLHVHCVKAELLRKSNYKLYRFCHLVARML